jgi:RNA polymerase sigma-70 factor (ECF subfamily)
MPRPAPHQAEGMVRGPVHNMLNNDEKLVSQYLAGDKKSLEILIKKYLQSIYNFTFRFTGNPFDTEDIVQEIFVKAWKNIKKFDSKKSFKTWLFTIAKNTSIDFLRKKKATPFSAYENEQGENLFLENLKELSPLPDELCAQQETIEGFNSAIKKLSPKYREIFALHTQLGLTFSEIAEKINEPLNTVKSRYRRGLTVLKKIFNQ